MVPSMGGYQAAYKSSRKDCVNDQVPGAENAKIPKMCCSFQQAVLEVDHKEEEEKVEVPPACGEEPLFKINPVVFLAWEEHGTQEIEEGGVKDDHQIGVGRPLFYLPQRSMRSCFTSVRTDKPKRHDSRKPISDEPGAVQRSEGAPRVTHQTVGAA